MSSEIDLAINDAFAFEKKKGMWVDWPDISSIVYGCEANYGRSVLANFITDEGISTGQLPPFFVNSGSLVKKYNGILHGLHPLTAGEISGKKGRPLYLWELAMYDSKPLSACSINESTDVILFVDGPMAEMYLDNHLGPNNIRPRSVICYPLNDPSTPSSGQTHEEAIAKTYQQIEHFIFFELKNVIKKVRDGSYDTIRHSRNMIYYPLGLDINTSSV